MSEGEQTFVSFLYFYYLISGEFSSSASDEYDVVVIDDPISSLDSEVLFLVSHFVKDLIERVARKRRGEGSLSAQIFVLTHNIYFHRQITEDYRRKNDGPFDYEKFWIIRKLESGSVIKNVATNPIKSAYEFLWAELRVDGKSSISIQNTMRRILETYFKNFGGINLHALSEKFEGREKIICKSLISFLNAGAHVAQDELYASLPSGEINVYFNVFRLVFDKHGHIGHYNMMMNKKQPRFEYPSPVLYVVSVAQSKSAWGQLRCPCVTAGESRLARVPKVFTDRQPSAKGWVIGQRLRA